MKAFLIDPAAQMVTEVEHTGDYREIYKFLGCHTFDVVGLNAEGDGVYIDDEGMLCDPEFFFTIGNATLAGRGLVLGSDSEGDSCAPKITLEELRGMVSFCRKRVDGFERIPDGVIEHPVFGQTFVIGSRVRLKDRE